MLAIRKNRFTWTATTHTVFNTPSYIWSNKTGCCLGQLFKLSQSSADLTLILTTKSVVTNNPHFHCTNAFTAAQIHLKLHMLRRTAHKKPYWIWNVLAGDNFGRSLRGKSRHLGGGFPQEMYTGCLECGVIVWCMEVHVAGIDQSFAYTPANWSCHKPSRFHVCCIF